MFNDEATKQLIIKVCEFRDKVGLKSKNDDSNYILITNERNGEAFKLTEAEIKAIKQVIDKEPKLQELASELQTACTLLLGYFHFAVNY